MNPKIHTRRHRINERFTDLISVSGRQTVHWLNHRLCQDRHKFSTGGANRTGRQSGGGAGSRVGKSKVQVLKPARLKLHSNTKTCRAGNRWKKRLTAIGNQELEGHRQNSWSRTEG